MNIYGLLLIFIFVFSIIWYGYKNETGGYGEWVMDYYKLYLLEIEFSL